MTTVHVLMHSSGYYDDHYTSPIAVYSDRETAKAQIPILMAVPTMEQAVEQERTRFLKEFWEHHKKPKYPENPGVKPKYDITRKDDKEYNEAYLVEKRQYQESIKSWQEEYNRVHQETQQFVADKYKQFNDELLGNLNYAVFRDPTSSYYTVEVPLI